MATAVEEPDLFNGLEITEMDEMNLESSDEYVFIPSDNENDDDNGSGTHASVISQSVIQPRNASEPLETMVCEIAETIGPTASVERMDTAGDQLLAQIDLGKELMKSIGGAHVMDGEIRIVKRIDLTAEDDTLKQQEDQRFTVSYDFNLDMQQLLSIQQAEDFSPDIAIKEEIEIEEAVVNLPDDEEAGSSTEQMDLIHHDEHNLGSEVITLDSDAAESENEEDNVLLTLLEQSPLPIKEERPDDDKTSVENDHAYSSQTEQNATNVGKPDDTMQSFMDISQKLLKETDDCIADKDQTLKSIADIEEQLKQLKEKLLAKEKPVEQENDNHEMAEEEVPPPTEPDNEVTIPTEAPSRKESTETDALSLELSENCSERLECNSVSDLAGSTNSETSDKGNDIPSSEQPVVEVTSAEAVEKQLEDNVTEAVPNELSPNDAEPLEQVDQRDTDDLSNNLSPNASEPMEHEAPMGTEEEPCLQQTDQEQETLHQTDQEQETLEQLETVPVVDETISEEMQLIDDNGNKTADSEVIPPNRKSLEFDNVEDLIAYGELYTEQCEKILDMLNNNRRALSEEDEEQETSNANKEECSKVEQYMASLTSTIQRLSLKLSSNEATVGRQSAAASNLVDVSVQTEKIKRPAVNAKALNEKYKKRLLSSLEAEALEKDSSDSDSGSTSSSSDGDDRSSDVANEEAYGDDDDDEDEAAFERRQNRRKTKRLREKLAEEKAASEQEESDEDNVQPSKKRSARRLGSTDSSISKEASVVQPTDEGDEIPVKNEPYTEMDSEPQSIAALETMDDNNDETSTTIKHESSLEIAQSEDKIEQADDNDDSSKEENEDVGADDQSDSGLLNDVLGEVDDILLDVNDILPAAEGVVQDYLVEEEVRTEQTEEHKEQERDGDIKRKAKRSGKKIDSEEEAESGSEQEEGEKSKAPEDMTESELEEYYDNLRDKEIDKLCNLTNLEVARNAYPQKPQEVKKKPVLVKKKERVMDDILNNVELNHESEDSESDTEIVETEEQFLQKCNENMKNQLLNQLSSSDTDHDSGSEDSAAEALKQDENYDSDDSAGSILMEKFLKSLDKDHELSGEDEAQNDDSKVNEDADSSTLTEEVDMDKTKKSEKDFIDDSDMPEADNEEAMEKMKSQLKSGERKKVDSAVKEKSTGASKTATIDPIDKQLFSKKMFREVDETLRKDREQDIFSKENGSLADRSDQIGSDDSDVELLDVSMFQPKRKLKEKKLEDFDFSATAKRTAPQAKKPSAKDGDCISLSSESEAEVEETNETDEKENKQRKIRTMLTQDQLADETKSAQKDEEIRISRLKKKNENLKKFLTTFKPGSEESHLVLDYDAKVGKAICVHPDIVKLLKPHQKEGVRFMYDNTYGSVEYINKNPGSGCILAHCMGLGKTLQLITLLHTVMRYPQLKTKRVLVICPKSTVMNWSDEIQHWLGALKSGPRLKVFYFPDNSDVNDKLKVLSDWYSSTANRCGCMLIGYEAFRILVNYEKRKRTPSNILAAKAAFVKKKVDEYLLNPGADLVICDEGHQIKNKKSAISGAVSQIKTKRRIVLTGTPIQNNLKEYYCMVNFIKPSFLGSDREFANLYANPIKNGQHKDSDSRAIKIMKQRSYVLHNKLSRFVQRREAGVLKEFLPEKFEYVLFVPLTPVQEKMYEVFLQMNEYTTPAGEPISDAAKGKKFKLLADYTSLRKIWTHPKVLEKAWETAVQEKNKRDARFRLTSTPDSDDDRPDDYNDISSGALSVTNDWWRKHLEANDLESLYPSGKLRIMFEILKQCQERGEKCLIFSAFVAVLNVVEHFMTKIHNREKESMADVYGYSTFKGPWEPGKDYYRLDGKTQKNLRHRMITSFNDPSNKRTKCFLISAKAGGQGINLIGANRVIILDTSWNPSNDQQNIFRIFRLGQKKKCFVYRLLAMGTMEEKVYSRSVTKQAMSFRVVDEQQIDRHYSFSELAELYNLSKVADQVREVPILPADDVLASLLRNHPDCVFKYHEHDSLLENKPEQDLSEEDKREAWAAYEREIQNNEKPSYLGNMNMMPNFMSSMFPGGTGAGIGPYPPLSYSGLSGTLADMYRSDFGYGSGMNRLMYPYGNQPYPMVNDPSYSSIMGKSPYQNFALPSASSTSLPDFALPGAMNGQGSSGTTNYNSTVALQSLLDLYAKSMSSAMSSSTITTATATSVSPSTSTTSAGVSAYNALSSLKQFNGFPPGGSIPTPHSSPQLGPPKTPSQSPGSATGNAALINMLNEQPMPMSSAASSGPFSHLKTPLPAPSVHIPRSMPSALTSTSSTTSSPVLSTSAAITTSSLTPTLNVPQPSSRLNLHKPSDRSKANQNAQPIPLTTTVVASDDDDVDDDGIPRPHIIVRDPLSINSSKSQQEQDKIVKKINMGIVYPEEKKKDQSKDIMLSAKSITTLAKPTIAVKNVESMKAIPTASTGGKTSSPVSVMSRVSSSGIKPIRGSPVQPSSLVANPKPQPSRQLQQQSQHPLARTLLSGSSPTLSNKQQSPHPRQQVPVITSAKSLQLSSPNLTAGTSTQSSRASPSSNASPGTTNSNMPRGAIAAQQLRELQQRMSLNSSNSSNSSPSSNNPNHLVVAKTKKAGTLPIPANQRQASSKPSPGAHPVGIFASPAATLLANQKQNKPQPGNSSPAVVGRGPSKSSLSDSVSITKITSAGQRIAMTSPSLLSSSSSAANTTASSTMSMNPSALGASLGRKQDLVITKTTPGSATVRKVLPGPNMIVKAHSGLPNATAKRNFPTMSPTMKSSGAAQLMQSISNATSSGGTGTSLPGGLTTTNSITVRKRKAPEPNLIDSLKAKNSSITISEVRSAYQPPAPKKPHQGLPVQAQKRFGSGITITPRKPTPQQQPQNILEVVEIE